MTARQASGGPSLRDTLLHPLCSSTFPHLIRLLAMYGCDARFWPRAAVVGAVCLLRQPLMWLESVRYSGRVRRQVIAPPPVFIIGHWRSGTTHLQNLMSQDTQFGRVTLTQAAMPHELLTVPETTVRLLGHVLPSKRLMDNVPVAANVPWEEEMALVNCCPLSFYHVSFFPRQIERIFHDAVLLGNGDLGLESLWKQHYLHFLRKVQYTQPGLPLLLKNPANTARIAILRQMFPGARFVHIHRDPHDVYASTVHLYLRCQEAWGLQRTDREQVARHVLNTYPMLMNPYLDQRECITDGHLAEVSFEDLQSDPIEVLRAIYREIGLPGFGSALPRFREYLDSQRGYRKNVLALTPEEKRDVDVLWHGVSQRLGYST